MPTEIADLIVEKNEIAKTPKEREIRGMRDMRIYVGQKSLEAFGKQGAQEHFGQKNTNYT